MSGGHPRLRVVRFHLGEQEAALPADVVTDVDAARPAHPHLATLLGETPRDDEARSRTLLLNCPPRGPLAVRVDGPVQFGHLPSHTLVALPARLPLALRGLVVGLWRRGDGEDEALGWRLAPEVVCDLAASGGAGADAATVVGSGDGEAGAAGGR